MLKLKSNSSELAVLLSFCNEVEKSISNYLRNNRELSHELLQMRVDLFEVKNLITKIEIKRIQTRENPASKKTTLTITPTQSLIFINYNHKFDISNGFEFGTISENKRRITQLLTNL